MVARLRRGKGSLTKGREMAGKKETQGKRLGDRPLSARQAMERIRILWKEGFVAILPHAQERMRQRHIDMQDLAHLIRFGRIVEHSKPAQQWRYKIEGASVDGEKSACVVEIDGTLIVVTVIA